MVLPVFLPECGVCEDCKSMKSNLCSNLCFKLSPWPARHETSRFTDLEGNTIYHFLFVSSFSEYTVLDVANLVKIDPTIPPNRACLLSCGVSTGNFDSHTHPKLNQIKIPHFAQSFQILNKLVTFIFRSWCCLEDSTGGGRFFGCYLWARLHWISSMYPLILQDAILFYSFYTHELPAFHLCILNVVLYDTFNDHDFFCFLF